jgi:hypothetical protein
MLPLQLSCRGLQARHPLVLLPAGPQVDSLVGSQAVFQVVSRRGSLLAPEDTAMAALVTVVLVTVVLVMGSLVMGVLVMGSLVMGVLATAVLAMDLNPLAPVALSLLGSRDLLVPHLDSLSLPVSHLDSPVASLAAILLARHPPSCLLQPRLLLLALAKEMHQLERTASPAFTPVRSALCCFSSYLGVSRIGSL